MSRKSVQLERRQQILEALHQCLLKKPFDQTSIKDIAMEAGINHGMLHYYFKSKEDILINYIDYIIHMYRSMFNDWLETKHQSAIPPEHLILSGFDFMYERITLNADISKIFIEIWEISNYNEIVREKLRIAYKQWIETVASLIEAQVGDKETAHVLSTSLVALLEGLSMFSVVFDRNDFPLESILEKFKQVVEIVLASLNPKKNCDI